MPKPILYVVACGARPAADLPPFVVRMQVAGWDVCVIATPDGLKFVDREALAELTGHPVRAEYKQPDEPDVLPPADAYVIAPATFNTVNKLAHGSSDTLALGLLNEAIGKGLPIVAHAGRQRRFVAPSRIPGEPRLVEGVGCRGGGVVGRRRGGTSGTGAHDIAWPDIE